MSDIAMNTAEACYRQLPISAVVFYHALLSRFKAAPVINTVQKTLSHGLTVLLLAVSLFGFYQLGSLALEARSADVHAAGSVSKTPGPSAASAASAVKSLPRSTPTALHLPSINVDAPIVGVSQDANGAIEVPGPEETGWYTLGPSPGEIGPAVIVGHVDYVTIGPAVFWNLRDMQPGDEISVDRQDGTSVKFKVTAVESYEQDAFPTQKVYGNIGYPGLRLVTCDGDFNYATHHYSNDLVVYARAEL